MEIGPAIYTARKPEESILYKVVAESLETFLAHASSEDLRGVPEYVEKEFRAFLECGVLAYGFIRLKCEDCKKEKLVPFSCKKRGFCPSCCGKRMNESTAHLVDNVIPDVPVRQFVVTVPQPMRYWMAINANLQSNVLEIIIRAINSFYRQRSGREIKTGAVTLIQRAGSALNLNVHFHILQMDGGYQITGDTKKFIRAAPPADMDIQKLLETISQRLINLLKRKGYIDEYGNIETIEEDQPVLSGLIGASIKNIIPFGPLKGKKVRTLIASGFGYEEEETQREGHLCAKVNYFSLHAATLIRPSDKKRLENLCRYVLRPPLAMERLKMMKDGRLSYELKKAWNDGTTHIILTPLELMAKVAALIPPPKAHTIRFHGLFAPHAKERSRISKSRKELQMELLAASPAEGGTKIPQEFRISWSRLLKRTFGIDLEKCQFCGGKTKILEAVIEAEAIKKILIHVGANPDPPPLLPARYEQIPCTL
jgi:hypothetical protein